MKRVCTICGICGVTAIFAVTALCQNFDVPPPPPNTPPPETHAAKLAAPYPAPRSGKQAKPSHPVKELNVYELVEKLEALKARQEALDAEARETRALLNERFRTLQDRVGKATFALTPPMGYPAPPSVDPQPVRPQITEPGTGSPSFPPRTATPKGPTDEADPQLPPKAAKPTTQRKPIVDSIEYGPR